ncbi:NAD(P)-dependent oxidoreductase [Jiangella rhizosphaerae]|uniref:Hydroxyacid dehydrogenase n=1 Tax=Jiangella rhizosphaerae TaxID=2293569 RepID=A0A418KL11_9ACTN|nr:NAD(P)-dependent oxidoreductase [Jiangella rhizosphaerae]RIQ17831.1 hydroxyacid dehydrogenase [Jiangella rhizosphaerae]
MATVLVTARSFSSGRRDVEAELAAHGHTVVRGPAGHDLASLANDLAGVAGWIAGTSPVTADHLALAPRLRVVARYGVGVDAVDLGSAAERGIVVTNTPGANSTAVAEHALALLLASLRGVAGGDRRVRAGDWAAWRGRELGGLTVGILGFGRIGRELARRLDGFGCRIVAADPYVDAVAMRELGVEPVAADELPERCDAVSLHAPGGQTVVDRSWLQRLRRPLHLVNTARADLVDEDALAAAIRDRPDLFYAADALTHEHGAGSGCALLAPELAERVLVTPHIAAQTVEAIDRMGGMAVENVVAVLAGRTPPNPVPATRP